jgi:hypothetical protein
MTVAIIPLLYTLPSEFRFPDFGKENSFIICTPWKAFGCVASGLWSGFIIGWITEVYTSNAYSPV